MARQFALAGVTLMLVGACAKDPTSIAPVSMAGAYDNVSCSRAAELYRQETAKIPTLYAAQNNAQAGDAMGVFLIGLPVSSLSGGDVEGEIAATKGKILALGAKLEACGTPPAQVVF